MLLQASVRHTLLFFLSSSQVCDSQYCEPRDCKRARKVNRGLVSFNIQCMCCFPSSVAHFLSFSSWIFHVVQSNTTKLSSSQEVWFHVFKCACVCVCVWSVSSYTPRVPSLSSSLSSLSNLCCVDPHRWHRRTFTTRLWELVLNQENQRHSLGVLSHARISPLISWYLQTWTLTLN